MWVNGPSNGYWPRGYSFGWMGSEYGVQIPLLERCEYHTTHTQLVDKQLITLVSLRSIKSKWVVRFTRHVEATDQLKGENGSTTLRNVPMNSSYTGHRISPHKGSGQNQLSAVDSSIYVSGTGWNSLEKLHPLNWLRPIELILCQRFTWSLALCTVIHSLSLQRFYIWDVLTTSFCFV